MTDVFDQIGGDVLTKESKEILSEAFEDAVNSKVEERLELEIQHRIQKIDEDHSTKLEKLLAAIDNDHSSKLVAILERVDEDHTEKLKFLIDRHDKQMKRDASLFKENLVKEISNYIELYLEEALPVNELKEAVENRKASKVLDQMKQIMSLDESYISNTIADAVKEGRDMIDNLKDELNEAVKQNIKLTQELKEKSASLMLEKYTTNLSRDKRNYVLRMLSGKDPEYIKENFSYIVKMFEKDQEKEKDFLFERASKESRTVREKLDTIKKKDLMNEKQDLSPLLEDIESRPDSENGAGEYLNILKRQDRFQV